MDVLSGEKIKECLTLVSKYEVADIHIFERLDSTNTWLLKHKQCGNLCLAETQSAGRGRQGRHWVSQARGNIYLSYCYCFDVLPKTFSLSTLAVGIAVCEALKDIGLKQHGLKWPNDIYVNNKKLGGVLLETAGDLQQVVIGIGLNISLDKPVNIDQSWCCLDEILSTPIDRNLLIAHILHHVQKQLDLLQQEKSALFQKLWQKWDVLQNKTVHVLRGKKFMKGIVVDIDTMGQLGIQFEQIGLQYVNAAEIKVRC